MRTGMRRVRRADMRRRIGITGLALVIWGVGADQLGAQLRPVRRPPPSGPPSGPPSAPSPTKPTVGPLASPKPAVQPPRALAPLLARVRGEVIDSTTMQPLIGATVQFVASNDPARVRSVQTDSLGFYGVDSLPLGIYLVGVLHPQVERLGLDGSALPVQVADSGEVRLPIGLPSVATVVATRCRGMGEELPRGAFMGTVRRANGTPLDTTGRVRAQYLETTIGTSGLTRRFPARFASIDELGRFVVCGVPGDMALTVRAYAGSDSSGVVELRVPSNGLLLRDLVIGSGERVTLQGTTPAERSRTVLRGSGRVRGVVRDSAGRPLAGARVTNGDGGVEATSGASGQFVLDALPGGSRMIETRAVGFQPMRTLIDVTDSSEVSAMVALFAVAPVIDTVRTMADRFSQQMIGFENRRKMGFGSFLDEEFIERRNATFTADLLRTTPGISVQPGPNGRDQILLRGVTGSGRCIPNVFLNGISTPVPDGVIETLVRPNEIRAVEVYPGTGSVPAEFQGRNGCGSIVIWTGSRTGTRSGRR